MTAPLNRSVSRHITEKSHGRRSPRIAVFKQLGPGLVTGAADDDPSGIATYAQAGAHFGYNMLWTMLLTYPLMSAIHIDVAQDPHASVIEGLACHRQFDTPRRPDEQLDAKLALQRLDLRRQYAIVYSGRTAASKVLNMSVRYRVGLAGRPARARSEAA